MKFFLQEIATNFLAKYFVYKTLFTTNFVGNDYPRKNYLPIKILRKNGRKKSFLPIFLNKFARKISCNMGISSSGCIFKILKI